MIQTTLVSTAPWPYKPHTLPPKKKHIRKVSKVTDKVAIKIHLSAVEAEIRRKPQNCASLRATLALDRSEAKNRIYALRQSGCIVSTKVAGENVVYTWVKPHVTSVNLDEMIVAALADGESLTCRELEIITKSTVVKNILRGMCDTGQIKVVGVVGLAQLYALNEH